MKLNVRTTAVVYEKIQSFGMDDYIKTKSKVNILYFSNNSFYHRKTIVLIFLLVEDTFED